MGSKERIMISTVSVNLTYFVTETEEPAMKTLCCSSAAKKMSDSQMEKALKEKVAQKKRRERLMMKMLVLGNPNCGKQTFLKQTRSIFGTGFVEKDRIKYTQEIRWMIKQNKFALVQKYNEIELNNMNDTEQDAMNYMLSNNE